MTQRQYRILMFPQRPYPCDHAMLETVYTRLLPQRGHAVFWITRPASERPRRRPLDWNGTPVYLLPPDLRPRWWNRPTVLMRRFRTGLAIAEHLVIRRGVNVVQVRNDLTAALVAL